ncbi:MAG: hypothetical protein QOI31_1198 [Solirubrobacterales bacterium]|nr:hypothetical protein [Solirubrobacterales bacterium]
MLPLALSNGDVILLIVLVAIPIGALSFIGSGEAFKQIGRGPLSIEQDFPQGSTGGPSAPISAEVREAEIRQFLEAKSYRLATRGEKPLDIDAELERILANESRTGSLTRDAQLVSEVRQLVEASNARRIRMGREPLDVEAEVKRQLTELESLGQ